jgi:hypothetical protein
MNSEEERRSLSTIDITKTLPGASMKSCICKREGPTLGQEGANIKSLVMLAVPAIQATRRNYRMLTL